MEANSLTDTDLPIVEASEYTENFLACTFNNLAEFDSWKQQTIT